MTHRDRRTALKSPNMPSPYRDPSNAAAKKFRNKANPQSRHHPTSTLTRLKEPALASEIALLKVLANVFEDTLKDEKLQKVLQTIKGYLYEKKFLEVFREEKYLKGYAVRWVPGRALAFREMFTDSEGIKTFLKRNSGSEPKKKDGCRDRIVCLGGGAGSELLALGCAIDELTKEDDRAEKDLMLVDLGPYQVVVDMLEEGMKVSGEGEVEEVEEEEGNVTEGETTEAKAKPITNLTSGLRTSFHQLDILQLSTSTNASSSGSSPSPTLESLLSPLSKPGQTLFTLLFTITELLLQSRPQTLHLLRRLTDMTTPGDLLLLADSANEEASSLKVGEEKAFPVTMLVDHLLCGPKRRAVIEEGEGYDKSVGNKASWVLLESEDTKWYRLRDGLQDAYPGVKLENLRFWKRLYVRV